MDIKDFIFKFSKQFEETEIEKFNPECNFKELDEWNSLLALSIIAMVDEEYGVALKGDDIRSANTIEDLFGIVKSKK